eukprot:CAMPEP_0203687702 /NCGR_PEP_ID=MMETSP0091-20130426/664_1 /ASSEMBLY_ACC=CAM_ASM_001089 /TAXON_ID=426623 /ORGANISM="Chaetoceros affinis, Strain CCMP159" /LENGTH=500 /DNA_ID=CAMNT_0050557103 /DNA_START=105 /DNA_END=1607 /DNA_ORIENTATION=-
MPVQTEPQLEPTVPKGTPKGTMGTIDIRRVDSTNWTERGTKESIGGVLGIVKNRSRSSSRGPGDGSDRGRSSSRVRGEGKGKFKWRSLSRGRDSGDESGDGGSKRGRASSRGPLAFLRGKSNSRDDKGSGRGRSKSKREKSGKSKNGPKLPPLPPSQKVVEPPKVEEPPKEPEPEPEPEVDDEIDKLMAERQLIAEVEAQNYIEDEPQIETRTNIDSLNHHDVMQLDEKNTTMHVACLLHHATSDILQRLDEDPSLAENNNNANETPLHYAAMDKRGVNKEVLKKLIQYNPEAVKQPNVQNSLPVHLACMVGAPSTYAIKTFLKMYPKAAMIQSDFPLLFEDDMTDTTDVDVDSDDEDDDDEFVSYKPKSDPTAVSGIASMFACAAPHQAALEMAHERSIRKQEKSRTNKASNDEGPKVETGFSPLHLAVMNSASPAIIEILIKVNRRSIHLKTSRGRTALDCAQYIVRQHWLYGTDDENAVQNTFGAIEFLEEALDDDE